MIRLLLLAWLLDPAAEMSAASSFEAGMLCFSRLDFVCARDLLTDALQRLPVADAERRLQARRALAESQLALGQREAAVAQFEALLLERPDFAIDRRGVSPKILDALDEARARLEPRPTADAPRRLELFSGGGAEFVTGADRSYLVDGPTVGIGLRFRRGVFRLTAQLRYAQHAAETNSRSLHLGGGGLLAGLAWPAERWEAEIAAGVGLIRFGVPAEEGRWAWWLPLRAGVAWHWFGRFSTGLSLTPAWLVNSDGSGLSFAVSLEGVLGFLF